MEFSGLKRRVRMGTSQWARRIETALLFAIEGGFVGIQSTHFLPSSDGANASVTPGR
jgi:hypothetical protein